MAVVTVTAISGVSTVPLVRLMRFGVTRNTLGIVPRFYCVVSLTNTTVSSIKRQRREALPLHVLEYQVSPNTFQLEPEES